MWVFGMYESIVLVKIEFLLKKKESKNRVLLGEWFNGQRLCMLGLYDSIVLTKK